MMGISEALRALLRPVSEEKKRLLCRRWNDLPDELRVGWQVVGRQISHCGYTLGASYCSFGCTHCYLPSNANRAPIPTLDAMKRQIDAGRSSLGELGALQLTGGDLLDAYRREDRAEELVEVVRYATQAGLAPMLMTHGQVLLDDPDYFDRLVVAGRLRRIAIHVDMTQAGRPELPIRSVRSEADLHPLRDRFVAALQAVQRRTGRRIVAALTVTVTDANLATVHEIVNWMRSDPKNARTFRLLSFQPEAAVGRTRISAVRATPERLRARLEEAFGIDLPSGSFWFGDPDCNSVVCLALQFPRPTAAKRSPAKVLTLTGDDEASRNFLTALLKTFGGVGSRSDDRLRDNLRRLGLLLRRPRFLWEAARFGLGLLRQRKFGLGFCFALAGGRVVAINVAQHNFMDQEEVQRGGPAVERRLAACSFRGAVEREGSWVDVPMCSLNSLERERLYDRTIRAATSATKRLELTFVSRPRPLQSGGSVSNGMVRRTISPSASLETSSPDV